MPPDSDTTPLSPNPYPLDFLAIGDIVTEPFIRLQDARVTCDIDDENCTISMRWGDKIPYESVVTVRAVGNAANAAVAAARLGLGSSLVTDIGDDEVGKGNREQLAIEGVSADFVTEHAGMKSNYHYVLSYESERTILVKHEAYPYQFPTLAEAPRWLYLSSLSEHSAEYHAQIAAYLAAHPEVKLAFQPGTFQMKMGVEALKGIYERTDIFFCNREEATRILEKPELLNDVPALMKGLASLGPKTIALTDGPHGAYAFDGTHMLTVPMYPDPRPPVERTGAGDAFASSVTAALVAGEPFEKALLWGPINSMGVVQEIGAQKGLLSREALLDFLAKAPPDYKVSPL